MKKKLFKIIKPIWQLCIVLFALISVSALLSLYFIFLTPVITIIDKSKIAHPEIAVSLYIILGFIWVVLIGKKIFTSYVIPTLIKDDIAILMLIIIAWFGVLPAATARQFDLGILPTYLLIDGGTVILAWVSLLIIKKRKRTL